MKPKSLRITDSGKLLYVVYDDQLLQFVIAFGDKHVTYYANTIDKVIKAKNLFTSYQSGHIGDDLVPDLKIERLYNQFQCNFNITIGDFDIVLSGYQFDLICQFLEDNIPSQTITDHDTSIAITSLSKERHRLTFKDNTLNRQFDLDCSGFILKHLKDYLTAENFKPNNIYFVQGQVLRIERVCPMDKWWYNFCVNYQSWDSQKKESITVGVSEDYLDVLIYHMVKVLDDDFWNQ